MGSTADGLYENLMLDVALSAGQICDFGVDTFGRYATLQSLVRNGSVSVEDLRRVSGDGPEITKLVRTFLPKSDIVFKTIELGPEEEDAEDKNG